VATSRGEIYLLLQSRSRAYKRQCFKSRKGTEHETRYYITSLAPDATLINGKIRQHWGIENKLHWVLDVAFGEDLSRKRAGNAAQNFSLLNRIALNLLKLETSLKRGIKGKTPQSRMGSPLPAQTTRGLICVGPGELSATSFGRTSPLPR
jgi:predicted transposase YbfD/YdcC